MRLAFTILIPSMVCALVAMAAEPMNGWQPLFDGKTLDGWQVRAGHFGRFKPRQRACGFLN